MPAPRTKRQSEADSAIAPAEFGEDQKETTEISDDEIQVRIDDAVAAATTELQSQIDLIVADAVTKALKQTDGPVIPQAAAPSMLEPKKIRQRKGTEILARWAREEAVEQQG